MKSALKMLWWTLMLGSFSLFFRGACSGMIGRSVTCQGPLTIYTPGPDMTWLVWVSMGLCALAWALDHLVIRRMKKTADPESQL